MKLQVEDGAVPRCLWSALGQDEARNVEHKTGGDYLRESHGDGVVGGEGWEMIGLFAKDSLYVLLKPQAPSMYVILARPRCPEVPRGQVRKAAIRVPDADVLGLCHGFGGVVIRGMGFLGSQVWPS